MMLNRLRKIAYLVHSCFKQQLTLVMLLFAAGLGGNAYADTTIINNNPSPPPAPGPAPSSGCNQGSNSPPGLEPGTYKIVNGDGSASTMYTTGDKKPFIVDNSCNNQPVISPEVYPNYPTSGASGTQGSAPAAAPTPARR